MATKTIDYLGFRMDVTPYEHEGNTFNRLSVSVGYQKGRGFYVTLHPVLADGGELYDFSRNPLSDTTWINVEQATKNNSKRLTAIYENVKQGQEAVRLCFDARKWERMEFIIVNLAAHGYADWLKEDVGKFFETTSDNNQNNSEDKVMTNETMKVADLIGKSISNGGNAKYTINGIEGDKVSVTFQMGDSEGKPMTMGVAQVEKLLAGGWQVQGSEECRVKAAIKREQSDACISSAEREQARPQVKSEEFATAQEDSKAEEPKAKTVTMEKPKQEKPKAEKPKVTQTEAKAEEPKQEQPQGGRYRFSTYTRPTSDGGTKTLGRIDGLQEGDELLQRGVAEKIHASPMYDRDGERKVWWLSFGKRYVEAGRKVCQALNEGKSIEDCMAIVDAQTDENHAQSEARRQKNAERNQKREAYRQEREGRSHQPSDINHQPSSGKVYTEAEVADLMRRVIAGDQEAIAIVNAMAA